MGRRDTRRYVGAVALDPGVLRIPEPTLTGFDLRKHSREDVPPVRGVRRVFTRRRSVRSRMDVISSVVIGRMSVPPVVERSGLVVLVIVKREVAVLVPHDFEACGAYALRIEALVVRTDDSFGRERRFCIDSAESVVGHEPIPNGFQAIEIGRGSAN